jgi:hypothetical protein
MLRLELNEVPLVWYCRLKLPTSLARNWPVALKKSLSVLEAVVLKPYSEAKGPDVSNSSAPGGSAMAESQVEFRKAIQPDTQFVPALHCGAPVLAEGTRVLRQTVTQVLRFTASLRARAIVDVSSLLMAAVWLRLNISLNDGAASDARIASTLTVTINSISVKPRLRRPGFER